MSTRVRGVLQYDGTAYRGWQRQADAVTIQETCERALESVLGQPIPIVAAGRTDTGVHARGQVIHLQHDTRIEPHELRRAWNAHLPSDIWLERLATARADFHARHHAVQRTYRYFIADGPDACSPFLRRYRWALNRRVDWPAIEAATPFVVGVHDFRNFAKGVTGAEAPNGIPPGLCEVTMARWSRTPDGRVFEIRANRFIRHMVRGLVGALIAVGRGSVSQRALCDALDPGGARVTCRYAPPDGLFLWCIEYEE